MLVNHTRRPLSSKGFTLIELLVTVALIAVLMAVATPSFTSFQRNSQLTAYANGLLAAINAARSEAMKRGKESMVVPKDGTNWSSGVTVFVDLDRNRVSSNADLILYSEEIPNYISISGSNTSTLQASPPYLIFDASGYARDKNGGFGASTMEIKRTDASGTDAIAQTRRLKIASTGRAYVCTPKSSTDTNCSQSS